MTKSTIYFIFNCTLFIFNALVLGLYCWKDLDAVHFCAPIWMQTWDSTGGPIDSRDNCGARYGDCFDLIYRNLEKGGAAGTEAFLYEPSLPLQRCLIPWNEIVVIVSLICILMINLAFCIYSRIG